MYFRIVRADLQRPPIAGDGIGTLAELEERVSQIVLCLGRVRVDVQGSLIERYRLAGLSQCPRGIGCVDERLHVVRLYFKRPPQAYQCLVPLSSIVQRRAEIAVGFNVMRQQLCRSA
ncbi:MAG TPA: hypothetical protein VNO35_27040 [Steroidobacteraceae bacterium]|nr:hypothetical protein [Steroidobacteraceae bacterium]